MWCMWLLGHHQDIQQKAFEEITAITNGNIQYEEALELKYLDCIVKVNILLLIYFTYSLHTYSYKIKKKYRKGLKMDYVFPFELFIPWYQCVIMSLEPLT